LNYADLNSIPARREWIGDDGLDDLVLNSWTTDEEFETFRRLFPEARFIRN
jgi:hypothetical protein